MKKWEKQWREGVASGKSLSSGCAPGGVWLRSPRLGLWSPASLPSYAWTWCSIQVPRKLPRPCSSLWSPLRVCSSTQWPGASPKCVSWQKLITWLKAACPGSTHYPRHTHSLGTTTLYAPSGSRDHWQRRPLAGDWGERSRGNELGLVGAGERFRATLWVWSCGYPVFPEKCSPTRDNWL